MQIKTSIIITTLGRWSRLALVLKALDHQVDEETEVVIVFDGYQKDIMDYFNSIKLSYRPITVLLTTNRGRAAARNIGIKNSSGDLFIFIDDDRVPAPDFVKKHQKEHRKDCVVIGGRMEICIPEKELEGMSEDDAFQDGFKKIFANAHFESGDILLKRIYFFIPFASLRCLGFTTGNVSITRAAIKQSGFFNENFKGWGYEDTELAYRLVKNKIKIIRKPSILNCHLLHDFNLEERFKEEFHNHLYFFRLIKKDFLLKSVVLLIFTQFIARFIFWKLHSRLSGRKQVRLH